MADLMKKSAIYSMFGKHYGDKLYKLLNECCDDEFCKETKTCLGISATGDASKVLNQKGEWTTVVSNYKVTRQEMLDLIATDKVVTNASYLITNAQASHTECVSSKVLVYGTSPNTVSVSGIRFQLVPDYIAHPIWNDGLTPSVGDKVIYGSRVWVNLTGNLGSPSGYFPANLLTLSNDWEQVPYEEGVDYTFKQISCKYNIKDDLIVEQEYGGLKIGAPSPYTLAFGFSPLDYCDWGQVNKANTIIQNVEALIFLNNPYIINFINIFSTLIINNDCKYIQQVSVISDKITTFNSLPIFSIAFNKCKSIKTISNAQSIVGIPEEVGDYTWVTDDESGYLERDFSVYNLPIGDTLVLGCILNKGVAFTGVQMASDGNLPAGININFGIDVDNPSFMTKLSDDINAEVQYANHGSVKTSDFHRLLILTASDRLDSGVLRIAYKYL